MRAIEIPLKSDPYKNIPFVVYYALEPGKRAVRTNYQCFGLMYHSTGIPSALRYIAPVNKVTSAKSPVADGAVEFYLEFLKRVLRRPESPRFMFKRIRDNIHFRITTKGLRYKRMLFFLTWFRYVHHYPEVIHELFIRHKEQDDLEATFKNFFEIHNDMASGKMKPTSVTWADEMVMYNWGGKAVPITLEKLWGNMANAATNDTKVQDHFK